MSKVWLIRHGESVSNANLPTTHPAKSALTPKGVAEAQQIVRSFPEKPSLVIVSPYLRAQQTAEPTLQHFAPIDHEEWPVHEFTYLDPIRYKDTTGGERRPYALSYWHKNEPHYKENDVGESFAELLQRVQAIAARLQRHPAEFIVVFSHGLFLRALIWSMMTGINEATKSTMQQYSHFVRAVHMPNGAICKAQFSENGRPCFSGFYTAHLLG